MPKVWKIAPGKRASHWKECQDKGCILLGWNELTDFTEFDNEEEIVEALGGGPGNGTGAGQSIWRFTHDVHPGDIVIANKGRSGIAGIGLVIGGYLPAKHPENPTNDKLLPHARTVK